MRTRFHFTLAILVLSFWARIAAAAPEAHLLRVDPRASQSEGSPVLTTVIELVQNKRLGDALAECAMARGEAQVDCQSEKLEAPQALYSPIAPFPEQAAVFTVDVEGDRPAQFVSTARWGESLNQPGVGTAWLILIDAAGSMSGPRFEDAKSIANAFIGSMTASDIVDVMFFADRQVVSDSKWQPASAKGQVQGFVNSLKSTYPMQGRARPLFNIIKTGATDAFKELGNVGTKVQPPLHQAMIVLSNGMAGADAASTGPATIALNQYLTKGRFPEENTVQPKTPLPVISIWTPTSTWDELRDNAQQFMQGLANTEVGGFYDVVRPGLGAAKAQKIVSTVRTRFNQMYIVKWRVSCIAPSVTQSFKLVFSNTTTPILGDSTFKDVPIGIDPTQWPLDLNIEYTKQMADRTPVEPGGELTLYGNFCWGGDKDRAEVYFVPTGNQLPAAMVGTDLAAAQRTQQQLIASGMRGTALQSSDSDVKFEAPDKDKILWGSGSQAVVRLVVYDNKAHRASGVTASTVLTLKASTKSLPVLWIIGGAFGVAVIALLGLVALRGGGKRRPGAGPAPAPVVAGGAAYTPAVPMQGPAPAYGGNPLVPSPFAPVPPPAAAPNADFMYGGQAPQYGLTGAQAQHAPMPADPYAQPAPGGAGRATLTGAAGLYTVMAGFETAVGRDAARCQIVLAEPRVSGVHARLKIEGGYLYVIDDQSNNGTSVGGQRIAPNVWTLVASGSLLRFGPVEFSVRLE